VRLFALSFLLGTFLLQQAARLPEPRIALAGVAALLALGLVRARTARCVLLVFAGALLGHGYAAWRAQERLADELPFAWEGADIAVVGIVADLPQVKERGTRFVFDVEQVTTPGAVVPERVSLMWYPERAAGDRAMAPDLKAGQRWRLTLRLKRVRGLSNPHAFDFEPWALERGLRATGYVRTKAGAENLSERVDGWPYTLHRWRGEIRDSMRAALGDAPHAGVLVALAIGDQDAIPPPQWDVFWRTGVGHLMSISGLHITMLAALGFAITFFAWARVPALALRVPARKAAVVAGIVVGLGYTLMTGFAVPAQRTVMMLGAIGLCVLADRHGSASRVLAVAALAVLIADPWAVLAGGFWLSFGAVAAIFYAMALRAGREGRLRAAITEQAAVTLVMVPMLAALFQEFSLVSPLANALAIPVVSIVVVPLAIAGAFLDAGILLEAAHAAMAALMFPLEALASWPHAMVESHEPVAWTVAAAVAGCAWLLAPRGVPLRPLGVLWLVPLFAVAPPRPAWGEAWLDVLDVGSGLAVVVRTSEHALVYDAGPSWGDDSDSGDRIVVPFLRGEGITRLDALVVTHADDDHAGGAISVAALREPPWLLSSLPPGDAIHGLVPRSTRCAAGQSWVWDGVEFRVLHPAGEIGPRPIAATAAAGATNLPARHPGRRNAAAVRGPITRPNDQSCVLRIATPAGAALLTGDIEARSELEMLRREPQLDAQLLLVPHHGSRTSSTADFLDAVAPSMGLISVGHRNRFRHPNPAVVARYSARGIALCRTDREGALRAVLPAEPAAWPSVRPLLPTQRYWSDRTAGL
jgi:competence protein ComEC